MSDTVKLIIEIPKTMYENVQNGTYCGTLYKELKNGIPLDDVKAEIDKAYKCEECGRYYPFALSMLSTFKNMVSDILDNIGKESEVKPNDRDKH